MIRVCHRCIDHINRAIDNHKFGRLAIFIENCHTVIRKIHRICGICFCTFGNLNQQIQDCGSGLCNLIAAISRSPDKAVIFSRPDCLFGITISITELITGDHKIFGNSKCHFQRRRTFIKPCQHRHTYCSTRQTVDIIHLIHNTSGIVRHLRNIMIAECHRNIIAAGFGILDHRGLFGCHSADFQLAVHVCIGYINRNIADTLIIQHIIQRTIQLCHAELIAAHGGKAQILYRIMEIKGTIICRNSININQLPSIVDLLFQEEGEAIILQPISSAEFLHTANRQLRLYCQRRIDIGKGCRNIAFFRNDEMLHGDSILGRKPCKLRRQLGNGDLCPFINAIYAHRTSGSDGQNKHTVFISDQTAGSRFDGGQTIERSKLHLIVKADILRNDIGFSQRMLHIFFENQIACGAFIRTESVCHKLGVCNKKSMRGLNSRR